MAQKKVSLKLDKKGSRLSLSFSRKATANDFSRMYFYSLLLHSLKPDSSGIWRKVARLDAEIRGWSKNVVWDRVSETDFIGEVKTTSFDFDEYTKEVEMAMNGIVYGETATNGRRLFLFQIGKDNNWVTYKFYSKARTIAALCVLYDLKSHPRAHLEINIPSNLIPFLNWPSSAVGSDVVRFYGDPSKTADVLRNEGWSREGANASMEVSRENTHGQQQQTYKLLTNEQNVEQQVMRTNIPNRWKKELYSSQNFTCRICHLKYEEEFLAPDHRVPVIFEADELTEANYKIKLMTLCRFCNQQKREFCKRIDADYDWSTSPWAYPEKFEIEKIKNEIVAYAEEQGISTKRVLDLLQLVE